MEQSQENALMDTNGHITTLGEQYIGAIMPNVSPSYQPGVVHGGNGTGYNPSGPSIDYASGIGVNVAMLLLSVLVVGEMLMVAL
jgi:hypothetical protein